jgi:K+-transporting ATPase ATPase A chain
MSTTASAWLELSVFVLVLTFLTPVLGRYLALVFGRDASPLRGFPGPLESGVYRVCRIDPAREMSWTA